MTAISLAALALTVLAIAASAARLQAVYKATALDWAELAARLKDGVPLGTMRAALAEAGGATAEEQALLDAALGPAHERLARTNEVLLDVDGRLQHWARVPRVAANIASTGCMLLASLILRTGLALPPEVPAELREAILWRTIGSALNVVCLGFLGAVTCAAINARARTARRVRMAGVDALVEELERQAPPV